jgi:hypothetical protein
MIHGKLITIGALSFGLVAAGCNQATDESRDTGSVVSDATTDRAAELEREKDEEIARMNERIAELEREYAEASQEVASGAKTATAGLREELKEDVANVRTAVNDLVTTTPENWWDRHEDAVKQTADDIEADVRRLAGKIPPARPEATTGTVAENVDTEPFTSRRDEFVNELRARVDAMERALENVTARGARETELEDTRARLKKLSEDVDRLGSASAEDWWDVTRQRVTEYIDRVEDSVDRLDENEG